MIKYVCEHTLTHVHDIHTCDGCCARVFLEAVEVEVEVETEYQKGAKEALKTIVAYLMEMNVLREAMFYEGYVAVDVDGKSGVDLSINLGVK
jgi:hypothetical protein